MEPIIIRVRNIPYLLLITGLLWVVHSCYYDNEETLYPKANYPCDTLDVKYAAHIATILLKECNACHNSSTPSAKIVTDNHTSLLTIINNGKLAGSINHEAGYSPMPKGSNKLTDCELSKIRIWINAGAPNN